MNSLIMCTAATLSHHVTTRAGTVVGSVPAFQGRFK